MRFKIDENPPREVCDLLSRAGQDATSVGELSGCDDATIYERCQDEERALITLDQVLPTCMLMSRCHPSG